MMSQNRGQPAHPGEPESNDTAPDSRGGRDAEHARAASEARYRTLFETAGDAIFMMQLTDEGPIFLECNSRALEMFGRSRDEMIGISPADPAISAPTQPNGRTSGQMAAEVVRAALAGTPQRFEWDHYRRDGSVLHAEVTLNRLDLGDRIYVQAITRDITERKRAAASELLLRRELDHRVRNNLSTMLSLIPITSASSTSKEELEQKLTGRLLAIATAQEGLTARNWRGTGIDEMTQRMLQQYFLDELERCTIDGPDIVLPAGVSGPYAMCLNEIATNALKHGAMTSDSGRVTLRWALRDDGNLEVHWHESGGPPVSTAPQPHEGRGLGLVSGLVEHQLRGTFECSCDDGDLEIALCFPLVEQTYDTTA